ncbi:hypothetical protein [Flavobacterium sp. 1355]|uniref:hypothetical protein n=1 Tax=Flavobacterium sp. 1355 TaxID=2806571 RepID=UPI001AE87BC0|nr:hypothetical protein [Flavobacterium sp. 1355]MBP1221468.1 hypothetical protein [Flavobacterium sp. 1355]
MRHLINFFVILILLTGCKSPEEKPQKENKSPKEIVAAYLAATNRFDFKSAKVFLIPNKKNLIILETLKKMEKSIPDDQKSRFLDRERGAIYYEKEITDSTALIVVTPNQDIAMPIQFNLKKVKDKWLIESVILN